MTAPLEAFKRAIVRVQDVHGTVYGLGILVHPQWVLSCTHVVAEALEADPDASQAPQGTVLLDCPFASGEPVQGSVPDDEHWHPRSGLDLTLLHLNVPLSSQGYPHLSPALSLFGVQFEGWGAPQGHEQHLVPVSGRLEREISNGRYVANVQASNFKIRPGCSGGPIVDPNTGLVLGLIVQEELEREAAAGFAIPASQLRRVLDDAQLTAPDSVGPRLDVLLPWVKTRYGARLRLREEVLRFIDNYRDKAEEPRPFAGRASVLQQLDEWLAGPGRFLLISGPAGRGKSALLLHWLARLVQSQRAVVICYLPISIRFGIADELSGVQLLFAALCDVFGDLQENFPRQPQVSDYLDRIATGWRHIESRHEQQFLLVIDGLDEAVDQWFLKQRVLPSELPGNLNVLVSARHEPGHQDGLAWLEALDAHLIGSRLLCSGEAPPLLEVPVLERAAIAEAIVQLGRPLDRLAERDAFVAELFRLTDQGDPLLLTLWLGQLWRGRDRLPSVDVKALARLAPSFAGFYEAWMRDQQALWKSQGLAVRPEQFEQVLHVLALARGPLLLSGLLAVLSELPGGARWDEERLRTALEQSHRLVVGDAEPHGYVLVHPRLAHHFQAVLTAAPSKLRAVRAAFRSWGEKTVLALNSGALAPEECPQYLLNHYAAGHISDAEAVNAASLSRYYVPLLQRGWPMAWQSCMGSWQGYLNDLEHIGAAFHAHNQAARPAELRLAELVRIALLRASIHSLTGNLPAGLIIALVEEGLWSRAVAADMATGKPETAAQCLLRLAGIAQEAGEQSEAEALRARAWDAAVTIQRPHERAQMLSGIAKQLRGEPQRAVFQQALQAAALSTDLGSGYSTGLSDLVVQLHAQPDLLERALTITAAVTDPSERIKILEATVPVLRGQPGLQRQALEAAITIERPHPRAAALAALHAHLDEPLLPRVLQATSALHSADLQVRVLTAAGELQGAHREAALQQALTIAEQVQDRESRAQCFAMVAARLTGEPRQALLQRALEDAEAVAHPAQRANALCAVARQLDGDARLRLLERALELTSSCEDDDSRRSVLRTVAPLLEGQPQLLERALELVPTILETVRQATALQAITEQIRGQIPLLERVLQLAATVPAGLPLIDVLRPIAPQLREHPELLQRALQLVGEVTGSLRSDALDMLAVHLLGHPSMLRTALQWASAIQEEMHQVHALVAVAVQLEGQAQHEILHHALQCAAATRDPYQRGSALGMVAEQLSSPALLLQALELAGAIEDETNRAGALASVTVHLREQPELLEHALVAAGALQDGPARGYVLCAVVEESQSHPALAQRAVDLAAAIEDGSARAEALGQMAQHLAMHPVLLQQALQAAASIDSGPARVHALCALAKQLQGDLRHAALGDALQTATAVPDGRTRAVALAEVAAQLSGEVRQVTLQQALQAAAAQPGGAHRDALIAVAEHLHEQPELLEQALQLAVAIRDAFGRSDALAALAKHLAAYPVLFAQALEAAAAMQRADVFISALAEAKCLQKTSALTDQVLKLATQDEQLRFRVPRDIAEHAQDELRATALELAWAAAIEMTGLQRVYALIQVAELQEGTRRHSTLELALQAALNVEREDQQGNALRGVARLLAGHPDLQHICMQHAVRMTGFDRFHTYGDLLQLNPALLSYERWWECIDARQVARHDILHRIGDLTRCTIALTGRTTEAEQVAQAISDVGEWWP